MNNKIFKVASILLLAHVSPFCANWVYTASPDQTTTGATATKVGIGTITTKGMLTLGNVAATAVETKGITLGSDQNDIEFIHSTSTSGYGSKLYGKDDGSSTTSFRIATRNNVNTWTDRFFLSTSTGNVGIGSTSPKGKLTIGSTAATGVQSTGLVLGSDQKSVEFIHSTSTNGYGSLIYGNDDGNSATSLRFATRNNTGAWTDRMVLNTASGNVGIGTTSPSGTLHLNSAAVTELYMTSTAAAPEAAIRGNSTTWLFGYGGAPGQEDISMGTQDGTGSRTLSFAAGGKRRMRVAANGFVGIGTTTPSGTLHLNSAAVTEMYMTSTAAAPEAAIRGNSATWLFGYGGAPGQEDISMGTQDGTGSRTLSFAAGGKQRMRVAANGNVGIGTSSPGYLLDVNGDANINGTLKVASVSTHVWSIAPDYVFEKEYKLNSLEHVEKYVNENKHLPEIPSAKEIKEKGMDLAEMNLKLLKKVEELTLYSIRQEKRTIAQEKRINQLAERLQRSEKQENK